MIFNKTNLIVGDNSGGFFVRCVKVLNSYNQLGRIGSKLVVTVNKVRFRKRSKVKNRNIYYAVVVRTKKPFFRFNGMKLSFFENSVVLLDKKKNPLFNRVFGPVPYEIRNISLKILVSSEGVI